MPSCSGISAAGLGWVTPGAGLPDAAARAPPFEAATRAFPGAGADGLFAGAASVGGVAGDVATGAFAGVAGLATTRGFGEAVAFVAAAGRAGTARVAGDFRAGAEGLDATFRRAAGARFAATFFKRTSATRERESAGCRSRPGIPSRVAGRGGRAIRAPSQVPIGHYRTFATASQAGRG